MAGRIPQHFIDELVSRVDIVEVIDTRVPLKKAGREYVACCPFHSEKSPSFTVSPTKQFYHCFGCGAHGTAIGFLMEYEHMDFVEAVEELAARAGVPVPREGGDSGAPSRENNQKGLFGLLEQASVFFRRQLKQHTDGPRAVEYLKGRGLSGEIARDFGLGFAPPGWDNLIKALADHPGRSRLAEAGLVIEADDKRYDRFRDRVMFPIRDTRGRVIGFGGRVLGSDTPKYLNSPETPVFHKGRELYGLFEARQALRALPRLLVVEGYMDVVALAQFGIRYSVATLGTSVTREHLERLFRTTGEVVFCFDGDRAGREAAWRALENALPLMQEGRQVGFVFLPEGEDPDTLVRRIGCEDFEAELGRAVPLSQFFIEQLRREVDLSRIDGRARLVETVKPLLANVPDGVYRHLLLERLGELARVSVAELAPLMVAKSFAAATPERRPAARPGSSRSTPSPVRHALTVLMQQPSLAGQAGDPARFAPLRLPGVQLLVEVIELLQEHPHLTSGALLEHWRGTDEGRHLAQLAAREPLLPEGSDLSDEFVGALRLLERQYLRQRREELQEKPFRELSETEKVELNQLLVNEGRGGGS